MMVGVDALITSWCKIFKPESHFTASSLESAGEEDGTEALLIAGRPLSGTPQPPITQTKDGDRRDLCWLPGLQDT